MKRILTIAALLALTAGPAFAHPGHGEASSFVAGLAHPLGGLDHLAAMIAVGLWAALKGGRALWAWPAAFVGVMLAGGVLGMAGVALPLVEPGILASVVVLGLMVALAVDVPAALGAAVIATFALLHGHAHGSEIAEDMSGLTYMAGFGAATAALHLAGIAFAAAMARFAWRPAIRLAGALCIAVGVGLFTGTAFAFDDAPIAHAHHTASLLPGIETIAVALLALAGTVAVARFKRS
jgi:urease accessory protein